MTEEQKSMYKFRQKLMGENHHLQMFKMRLIPIIRYAVLDEDELLKNSKKIYDLADKMIEMGHEDIAKDITTCIDEMVPNFCMLQTGKEIEIKTLNEEVVAEATFDVNAMRDAGYNMDYVTGIEEAEE